MRLFKRKPAVNEIAPLRERIEHLEYKLMRLDSAMRRLVYKDGPCGAKYGPYANSLAECDTCGWCINDHRTAILMEPKQ